jgi:hypothetical protein
MLKKIIYIIIVLIAVLALVAGIMFFFNKSETSTPGTGVSIRDFLPFGGNRIDLPAPETPADTIENPVIIPTTPDTLRQIYPEPVSGAFAFSSEEGTNIRFVERSTGHVYETTLDSTGLNRVTITTIPKTEEAFFLSGDSLILRYLDIEDMGIQTVYGEIGLAEQDPADVELGQTGEEFSALNTTLFPKNISGLALSPDKTRIFSLFETPTGSEGFLNFPNNSSRISAFSSALADWNVAWPANNTIALTTKGSYLATGMLTLLNPDTGLQRNYLSDILGLSTLVNTNATKVLYSESKAGGSIMLSTFDIATKEKSLTQSKATLAEKCVWSTLNTDLLYCAIPKVIPNSNYPDDWYMGKTSFQDNLMSVNTLTGDVILLADINKITGREIDAFDLSLNQEETVLLFRNKDDLTLWALDLRI